MTEPDGDVGRIVDFGTVFNFRDLGGYRTSTGATVRRGRLYRADGLFRLSGPDLARFAALGIRTAVDLRRPDELAADGRIAEDLGLEYHHVCLQPEPWAPMRPEDGSHARYLADRYADIAASGLDGDAPIGTALRLISAGDTLPLVFHCAAGKDRTGVLAAVTLALLGVPDEEIARDYAVSAIAERRYFDWLRTTMPEFDAESGSVPAAAVPEAGHEPPERRDPAPVRTMLLFLAELRERHGSVPGYAREAGLTDAHLDQLRRHLLD